MQLADGQRTSSPHLSHIPSVNGLQHCAKAENDHAKARFQAAAVFPQVGDKSNLTRALPPIVDCALSRVPYDGIMLLF